MMEGFGIHRMACCLGGLGRLRRLACGVWALVSGILGMGTRRERERGTWNRAISSFCTLLAFLLILGILMSELFSLCLPI